MKKKLLLLVLAGISIIGAKSSLAQMVGDNVFLKGKYVELGVAPNGGYGSTVDAPANYHPYLGGASITFYDPGSATTNTSSNYLGFVADAARDGWAVGTPPFWGDFYLPGSPQEGWGIAAEGIERDAYIPNFQTSPTTGYSTYGSFGPTTKMSGTNIGYSNSGGISRAIWKGTDSVGVSDLDSTISIRQTTKLDTDKLYFTVNVVLVNTGTSPLNNIYYIRTVDPDNEETREGASAFTTDNSITYQLPNPTNRVLVSAVGVTAGVSPHAYLGLGTKDCRAKCTIFDAGLAPSYTLASIFAETTPYTYTVGTHYISDVGIGLVFNIGTLGPGDSTELTYCYILNQAYIDSALDATSPEFLVNGDVFTSGDTINICNYSHDTAVVSVGSGGFYHWHWSPNILVTDTTGLSNTIDVTSIVGTVTYTITGVNISGGCDTVRYNLTFTRDTFSINLLNHDTSICTSGTVQAEVQGPPHLSYSWSPAAGVSNTTITNPVLSPTVTTTYTVTASSASGCPAVTKSFTIYVYNPPLLSIDSSYVRTCVGVPVQLHVYATPADTPYTYTWTPPGGLSSNTIFNPYATPSIPGNNTYTVVVSPSALPSCSSTISIKVHAVGDFTLNTPNDTICLGQSINVSITGDDSIQYSWLPTAGVVSDTIKNPVITPTSACITTYTVTGNYAHCPTPMYVHSFFVEVDTPAHVRNILDTICLAMSDTFNVNVANQDSGCNYYSYQWSPTTGVSDPTSGNPILTPITTTTYSVTISPHDAGCAVQDVIFMDVLPNSISVSPTDTMVCKGAVVQAIGTGDPNFSYQWLPTAGIAASNVLNALIDADTTADYVVTASFHKCPDMHAYLHLDVQPNPTVYIGGNRFVCPFDTIHINAQVTPNWYPSYIYAWTPATNLDNTNTANVVFNGMTSTMLYLTVSTPAGCTSNDSAFVTVNPAPGTTIVPGMSFCPHDSAQLAPATSTPSTFQWMPPFYLSDSTGAMPWIHPITTQTYTIVATTAMGCKDTSSFTATVLPAAVIFMPDSVTIYTGDSYNIEPTTNCVSFTWFPPAGLSSTIISNPVATPEISTKYFVTGVTADGCSTIDSIAIIVEDGAILAMPNAFTPGNGVNSVFKINMLGQAQLNYFRVFNRWGNLVFETKDINEGWDGAYKGQPQPFGVFIYEVQAVTESGKIITKRGNITLLR